MASTLYTDSDEYQKEIAEQYKKRIGNFYPKDILESLHKLGFDNVKAEDLQTTTAGNMNATYLTPDLVIKINKKGNMRYYYANKVVSDKLAGKVPVVEVLAYDYFEKTGFEILVMKREPGEPLLDTIFDIPQQDVVDIFKQVLIVVKELNKIKFDTFGWINLESQSYQTFEAFLREEFLHEANNIRRAKLADTESVDKIEKYFLRYLSIFKNEEAVYVHTDTHMGNFLHTGNKLTALIDFDWSMKAPKLKALSSLLGFIGYPQQYTEGSIYFEKYKGKNFYYLLPTLREELREVFDNKDLLRKLNLLTIFDLFRWIAENWSENWNKEMIKNILENEMPETEAGLNQTYYGKILAGNL